MCIYVCVRVCMRVRVWVCLCACACVCVCWFIHVFAVFDSIKMYRLHINDMHIFMPTIKWQTSIKCISSKYNLLYIYKHKSIYKHESMASGFKDVVSTKQHCVIICRWLSSSLSFWAQLLNNRGWGAKQRLYWCKMRKQGG